MMTKDTTDSGETEEEERPQPPFDIGDEVETVYYSEDGDRVYGKARVYGRSLSEPFVVDIKMRVPAKDLKKTIDELRCD